MEEIKRYRANDGSIFDSPEKAIERETEIVVIEEITRACLKPVPTELNWVGYVTQNGSAVEDYQRVLMKIAKRHCYGGSRDSEGIWDFKCKEVHPRGIAGRFIDDAEHRPLSRAWGRLARMREMLDGRFREYNQPYYAIYPEKTEDVERGV